MGGKTKVPVWQAPGMFVAVEADATAGATVGVNLYGPNGRLIDLVDILNPDTSATPPPPTGSGDTLWRLIREIPDNILKLAELAGEGYAFRTAGGVWKLRQATRIVRAFSFGDAPAPIFTAGEQLHLAALRIVIDTPFNAASSITITAPAGVAMPAEYSDTQAAEGYDAAPDIELGMGDHLDLTIVPNAATQGAGRIIIETIPLGD